MHNISLMILTKLFFSIMIAWPMVTKLVVWIYPISFVIKIFKPYNPIVKLSGTIAKYFSAMRIF